MTTIVLPVSRDKHLDLIFPLLEQLECDREQTNLLTIVDGDNNLFLKVRNLTQLSKFKESLTIHFKSKEPFRS